MPIFKYKQSDVRSWVWGILLMAFSFNAIATDVQFTLSDFGASPVSNRTVRLIPQSPFVGNQTNLVTDGAGQCTFVNLAATLFNGSILAPPGAINFQIYVPATNLGTVSAISITAVGSVNTYPAGGTAWSTVASDSRYARGSNSFTQGNLTGSGGVVVAGGSGAVWGTGTAILVTNLPIANVTNLQPVLTALYGSNLSTTISANANTANLTTVSNYGQAMSNQFATQIPATSNTIVAYATGLTNGYLKAPTNSPTDGYVVSATGSAAKWVAQTSGGVSGNGISTNGGTGFNNIFTNSTLVALGDISAAYLIISTNSTIDRSGTTPGGDFIFGGEGNAIGFNNRDATIVGGETNSIGNALFAETVIGGWGNRINTASGDYNTIIGGIGNAFGGGGKAGFIGGGSTNFVSGNYGVAFGRNTRVVNPDSFLWGDGTASRTTAQTNTFLVYPTGGMGIFTNTPGTNMLEVNGNIDSTVGFSVNGVPISGAAQTNDLTKLNVNGGTGTNNVFLNPSALGSSSTTARLSITNTTSNKRVILSVDSGAGDLTVSGDTGTSLFQIHQDGSLVGAFPTTNNLASTNQLALLGTILAGQIIGATNEIKSQFIATNVLVQAQLNGKLNTGIQTNLQLYNPSLIRGDGGGEIILFSTAGVLNNSTIPYVVTNNQLKVNFNEISVNGSTNVFSSTNVVRVLPLTAFEGGDYYKTAAFWFTNINGAVLTNNLVSWLNTSNGVQLGSSATLFGTYTGNGVIASQGFIQQLSPMQGSIVSTNFEARLVSLSNSIYANVSSRFLSSNKVFFVTALSNPNGTVVASQGSIFNNDLGAFWVKTNTAVNSTGWMCNFTNR